MGLAENLAQGFASAAGADDAVAAIQKKKADRRATADEELQAKTQSILNDVALLQKRKLATPKGSPELAEIDKALTEHQQAFTDLYHPSKNPGALSKLGGFIRQHLGGPAPSAAPPTNAVTAERLAKLQGSAAGTGVDQSTISGKPLQGSKPYKSADGRWYQSMLMPDGTIRAQPMPEGYEAPAGTAKLRESVEPDPKSPTGYSKVAYDLATGQEVSRQANVLPPRGFIGSETTTTDPFGVTSTSVRKPVVPGQKPATAKPTPGELRKTTAAARPAGPHQLDAQGHIPASPHVNPQLREAANQILDGMDVEKLPIPQRDRAAAAELARSYGWVGQGLFGPKDKLLIRESTGILKQLSQSPSLSVLDSTASRLKIQQVLQNVEKRTMIGQTLQTITAQNLSPQEQEFVTLYNQAVGRISGLSQLVRSGRATEAQIERLKNELPNPATTSNSAHARQKLQQIQNEIDIALEKGQFVEGQQGMSDDDFLKKF